MKIIHMSDLHLSADGALVWEEDCRRKFLTAIKQIKMMRDVDAIIVSGDISNDGSLNSYYFADRVFSELSIPTYWCVGNHDNLSVMFTTFKPKFCHLSDQALLGGWRFYFVNSVARDNDDPNSNRSKGIVTMNVRNELDGLLSKNPEPSIVVLHHPSLEIGGWQDNKILKDRETFREMLYCHKNVKLVLSGHVHTFFVKRDKNILYSTASGIGFAFSTKLPKYEIKQGQEGFSCISLNKKDIFIENILLEVK